MKERKIKIKIEGKIDSNDWKMFDIIILFSDNYTINLQKGKNEIKRN
jgi:hypothetical protein